MYETKELLRCADDLMGVFGIGSGLFHPQHNGGLHGGGGGVTATSLS
ncbi:hypothetical protein ABH535_05905 [Escherichia coli]